jgi:hypothetical protein
MLLGAAGQDILIPFLSGAAGDPVAPFFYARNRVRMRFPGLLQAGPGEQAGKTAKPLFGAFSDPGRPSRKIHVSSIAGLDKSY